MKQNITVEDLNSLTFSQKQTLNSFWLPEKYDRAVASVCTDVENDVYENLEFVVGEIFLSHGTTITLKRLRMTDEIVIEGEPPMDGQKSSEEVFNDYLFDPGDYFLKENCMPLLSIGQLINLIRNTKSGHDGFNLDVPPMNDFEAEQGYCISDRFGEVDRASELVDLLFKILKEQL